MSDELDCLACSACCRMSGPGHILVPEQDIVRWKRLGRSDLVAGLMPGHFSQQSFPTRADGACVHLGTDDQPHACGIYEIRGTTCIEFEKGSRQCHEFRRDAGLSDLRPPHQIE